MPEEKIQEKTTVSTQPWSKTEVISQKNLYDNGVNFDGFGNYKLTSVNLNSFLYAVITKSTKQTSYYLGISMEIGGNAYPHMEYVMNGEKKYTNVINVDDETSCYGANINAGSARPRCTYNTNAAFPLSLELIQYIANLDQPFKVLFVSEDPTVIPFNDVIAPTEARALLDRVQQEAANLNPAAEAQPDAQAQ